MSKVKRENEVMAIVPDEEARQGTDFILKERHCWITVPAQMKGQRAVSIHLARSPYGIEVEFYKMGEEDADMIHFTELGFPKEE